MIVKSLISIESMRSAFMLCIQKRTSKLQMNRPANRRDNVAEALKLLSIFYGPPPHHHHHQQQHAAE